MKNYSKLVVVGDKVLVKPDTASERTSGGLFLPPGVTEKEKIQSGYIIKAGPGFPVSLPEEDEPWKESKSSVRYIPLQVKEGDLAIFLKKDSYEIEYEGEKMFIVPQAAILLIVRDDLLANI